MEVILKYFPDINEKQKEKFSLIKSLYIHWNEKINVISRKDIEHLYERHVLHSLGISKAIKFTINTRVLDVGTGGGFPGIPLAILYPDVKFHLVDSIGKKIKVVREITKELGLKNLTSEQVRAEEIRNNYEFIVSRAVTSLPDFYKLVSHLISKTSKNEIPNGILYLKGGDFSEELERLKFNYSIYPLSQYYNEEYFCTKKIVHIYSVS